MCGIREVQRIRGRGRRHWLQLWSLDESSAQAATSNSFLTASARFARMIARTNRKTLTFKHPFFLKAVDRTLPPGDYQVVTDEELIDGLSFPVYRRVSTMIFVPGQSASSVEMVTVDPLDLQAAHDRDAQEA
jgi:hypothetical protein